MNSPAGLGRRLAAVLYDSLLVFGLLYLATSAALALHWAVTQDAGPLRLQGMPFQLWLLAVMTAYFLVFWRVSGQTPGMRAWRLRLETLDGRRLSLGRGLLRLGLALLSWLCLGAGYWWLWLDRERRCWHDRWSGTRVVHLSGHRVY